MNQQRGNVFLRRPIVLSAIFLVIGSAVLLSRVSEIQAASEGGPLEVPLDNARTILVEAVTYGTNHVVGSKSVLVEHLGPWLPDAARDFLAPKLPQTSIDRSPGTLVVWLNAVNPHTRAWVDCQGLRLEFVDEHGDLWGTKTSSWHSFENKFFRIAHIFEAYPRAATNLTLRITSRRSGDTVVTSFPNPHVAEPASWSGEPIPVRRQVDGLNVVLQDLSVRTKGGPEKSWETPARYWQPEWRLLSGKEEAVGWREPEWSATDPLGNRGQVLGVHQPVLRYSVTWMPEVTNASATKVAVVLPSASIGRSSKDSLWFRTNVIEGVDVVAMGLMTSTMNYFMDGNYQAVPELPIGPTRGGSPTGWVMTSKRVTPLRTLTQYGHYVDRPTLYLKVDDPSLSKRIGVRVRDEQGRIWPTTRQPGRGVAGIVPFMLDVPSDVTTVIPEIVLLNPLEAEFTVRTPTFGKE